MHQRAREPQPTRPPAEESAEDPDAAIRRRVADSEAALIAAHARAIAAHPELTALLAPLVVHHQSISPGSSRGVSESGGSRFSLARRSHARTCATLERGHTRNHPECSRVP